MSRVARRRRLVYRGRTRSGGRTFNVEGLEMTRHPGRAGIGLALGLLYGVGFASPAAAAEFHVNNQAACSDAGPGSPSQPWCTIKKGLQSLPGGSTLSIHEGVYRVTEHLLDAMEINPGISGTAAQPTVIRNWPGDTPQIFLSERITPGTAVWTRYSGNIWKRTLPRNVNLANPELRPNPPELVAVVDPVEFKFLAQQGRCETPRSVSASSAPCEAGRSRGLAHA